MESHQGKRSREEIIFLNEQGRRWLVSLFTCLRMGSLHDADNAIFDKPIKTMREAEEAILGKEGKAQFRLLQDQFFLNGLWVKPIVTERENLYRLSDLLREEHLGGVSVQSPTNETDWRNLLRLFHAGQTGEPDQRARNLNGGLAEIGVESLVLHPLLEIVDDEARELPLPPIAFGAVTAYAKALLAVREFEQCGDGEEQVTALRKAQRVVCDLIDIMNIAPRLFFFLSLLKNIDDYTYHHSVNSLILALLTGREIGIQRSDQVDLAMALLFHDVGKSQLPPELLNKEGTLTAEDWDKIHSHPIESAKAFFRLGYMNFSVAQRILVAFSHHRATKLTTDSPKTRRGLTYSMFTNIASIVTRYDALTTNKAYRTALPPWEAIRWMIQEHEQGAFEKNTFRAFLSSVGPLPLGSWVKLRDNRSGIVIAGGSLALAPPNPLVFIPNGGEWIHDPGKVIPKRFAPKGWHKTISYLLANSETSPLTTI